MVGFNKPGILFVFKAGTQINPESVCLNQDSAFTDSRVQIAQRPLADAKHFVRIVGDLARNEF